MTSVAKTLAVFGLGVSVLSAGCNRQNEEEPMTPANATGEPRVLPDSRYEGGVRSSTTKDPHPGEDPTRPPETYPNPETTPPEMHPHHEDRDGSSPGAHPVPAPR
jgi:hypothetical protein